MPRTPYISRMINLEPSDYRTVIKFSKQQGLGSRGFSAALRIIIREWAAIYPTQEPVDDEIYLNPETGDTEPQDAGAEIIES